MRDGGDDERRWEDEGRPGGEDRERMGSRCVMEGVVRGGMYASGGENERGAGKMREGSVHIQRQAGLVKSRRQG